MGLLINFSDCLIRIQQERTIAARMEAKKRDCYKVDQLFQYRDQLFSPLEWILITAKKVGINIHSHWQKNTKTVFFIPSAVFIKL